MCGIEVFKRENVASVSDLLIRSFNDSIANTMGQEGATTFLKGVVPEEILKRVRNGNVFYIYKHKNQIVGVAELRDGNHINLLFVEKAFQNRGIGRELFNKLKGSVGAGREITVNSSLNAVCAYKEFDFKVSGAENEVRGITFQPMVYNASK